MTERYQGAGHVVGQNPDRMVEDLDIPPLATDGPFIISSDVESGPHCNYAVRMTADALVVPRVMIALIKTARREMKRAAVKGKFNGIGSLEVTIRFRAKVVKGGANAWNDRG